MSRQVTLELPDEVLDRAEWLARHSSRGVEAVLLEALDILLPSRAALAEGSIPLGLLADEEVLRLTELQLSQAEDERLSELLDEQQAGALS